MIAKLFGSWYVYLIVAALSASAAGFIAYKVANNDTLKVEKAFSDYKAAMATARTVKEREYRSQEALWQSQMDGLRDKIVKERSEDEKQNAAIRAAYDAKLIRLRIKGVCSGTVAGATQTPESSPGSNGDSIELSRASGLVVWDIREGIKKDRRTIKACQAALSVYEK